ncbi:sushi domain-containing protein 1 isoform X2 [Rhinatrema bivittatum]|uniref:sushi domain-containing protein 1 isoform X2 n=1 Tax=Rhinatrema bivittatum TaxID=194408 RepID=UPI0011294AC5|nr:sushi domain-containing protein 1 isoform X2 [Rhinatrema bivittatum]
MEGHSPVPRSLGSATLLLLLLQGSFRGLRATLQVDVCTTCHKNATCQQKDGKNVCICNYGFVGNGRTFCQDKDECQIGASKICGEHTACHNTYGSFYCICLEGYRPSNNNETFIPNDGTFCADIDECEISGLCGHGGLCRNLPGSFECTCMKGFRSENGTAPFQPAEDPSPCKVIDCGFPLSLPNSLFELQTNTTFGSEVIYKCQKGFVPESGNGASICTAEGTWEGASLTCKAIDCGDPPEILHSFITGNYTTVFGSEVLYECKEGFYSERGNSVVCTENGAWEVPTLHCKAVDCGAPPSVSNATPRPSSNTTYGSTVFYECHYGYVAEDRKQTVICNAKGEWEGVIDCTEIDCGKPIIIPNTEMIWNNSTRLGSVVHYRCRDGFYDVGSKNHSQCTRNQTWEAIAFFCKEIECGTPPGIQHADLVWSGNSSLGSVVYYECKEGFEATSGKNISVCREDGLWEESTCTAAKGDFITNVTVYGETCVKWIKVPRRTQWRIFYVFHIQGRRVHQKEFFHEMILNFTSEEETPVVCLDLHPGTNYTVDMTATSPARSLMQINLTIHMAEMESSMSDINIVNETCLTWNRSAEKARETYLFHVQGERGYQKEFFHEKVFNFTTSEEAPLLCLDLNPGTNYTVNVTGSFPALSAQICMTTQIKDPPIPEVGFVSVQGPSPRLSLRRAEAKNGPISSYQVLVLPWGSPSMFMCNSLTDVSFFGSVPGAGGYVAAEFQPEVVADNMEFSLGDRQYYGVFYNAPLRRGKDYHVILRIVSEWDEVRAQTCVSWAQIKGLSPTLSWATAVGFGSVTAVCFFLFLSFSAAWYCKRR